MPETLIAKNLYNHSIILLAIHLQNSPIHKKTTSGFRQVKGLRRGIGSMNNIHGVLFADGLDKDIFAAGTSEKASEQQQDFAVGGEGSQFN